MNCESVRSLLTAFYDGELDQAAQEDVRLHLQSCAQCAAELAEIRSLSERAKAAHTVLPDGLAARVRSRLTVPKPQAKPRPRVYLWAAAIAALAALAAALVYVFLPKDDPDALRALAAIKRAFNGADNMHVVEVINGEKQIDLWFGKRHTQNGKPAWALAVPERGNAGSPPNVAHAVPEYDGIVLRLELDPTSSGLKLVPGPNGLRTLKSNGGWKLTYDPGTNLPVQRKGRVPGDLIGFEFNKQLPKGLAYDEEARPYVQLK
jgi:hypothetical protein